MAVRQLTDRKVRRLTDCEDLARRSQWRDRSRFSRPSLFPRISRGTTGTKFLKEQLRAKKLTPARLPVKDSQSWLVALALGQHLRSRLGEESRSGIRGNFEIGRFSRVEAETAQGDKMTDVCNAPPYLLVGRGQATRRS